MLTIWKQADEQLWDGRVDRDASSLRYHQVVQCEAIETLHTNEGTRAFSMIGFASDEGVRRNQGRVGAAIAPNTIRKLLGALPYHHPEHPFIDVGNVACVNRELEQAQERLGEGIQRLLSKKYTPIIIGGGHETLYGHYQGVRAHIGRKTSLGIINIDAHFDLRDDESPSSGTMFSQIFKEDTNVGYLCLGIQELANTKALFDAAKKVGCSYIFAEDVLTDERTERMIDQFSEKHDVLMLSLCTDSISSAVAPGVSAASPLGLSAHTVRDLIRYIVQKKNTVSFELSEVNPLVDKGNKTATLAALLIADAIHSFTKK